MDFTKDLEMPEESRKAVNRALAKQRNKIAFLERHLETAFNAGFSLGFGSESIQNIEGQFDKFRESIVLKIN